jgi:hypothetical protein
MLAQTKHLQSSASPATRSSNPPKGSTTPITKKGTKPILTYRAPNLGSTMETKEHPDNDAQLGVGAHAAAGIEDEVTRPRRHQHRGKTNS